MRAVARIGLLVAAAACAGCVKSSTLTSGRHPWTQPGVLRVAVALEPKSLNPFLVSNTTDGFVNRFMFEPLVSADPKGNPVPMLAESVPTQANRGISADGLTIAYHLRKNARWSDGVPVGAIDVKWSWEAIMNANNNVISRNGYDDVRSIDTPDTHTVVVHLKSRFAPFVNTFFAESDQPYDVAPAHVLSRYPNINDIPFGSAPTVSDGPFRFVSWQRGDRIQLVANPSFFLGPPRLARIEIHIVPNEDTEVNLLRTHDVDYLFQPSVETYPALRTVAGARIVWVNVNGFEAVAFNLTHPPLDNPLVRRAIAASIDKAALTAEVTHGQSDVATEDLPNWIWAYEPSVRSVRFDRAAGRKLFATAGWLPDRNGMLRKNGRPLQLQLATDSQTETHRIESILLQAALRRAGVGVDVKYYPENLLYAPEAMGGILHGGRFDLILFPWFSGIDPDNSSQFLCANVPPHGYNDTHYCSPAMDAAQHEALARYDRTGRKAAYATIEGLLARDNPMVFFWWERQQEGLSVDFKGFASNPTTESWNAWQWSI